MKGENPGKLRVFLLILGLVFILLFLFVAWQFGLQSLVSVVKWIAIIVFFIIIVGLIVFAVFWLFKKHRPQLIPVMKRAVIDTCRVNSMDYKQELYTKGGALLGGHHRLGKILGYAVVKGGVKKAIKDQTGGVLPVSESKDIVLIAFTNHGKLKTMINGYSVFAGVYPDDFQENESFTGDTVYIEDEGRSLTPALYGFLWCSKHWERREIIEETTKDILYRKLIEYNFNDLRAVIETAQRIDPKEKEQPSMAEQLGLDKRIGIKQ